MSFAAPDDRAVEQDLKGEGLVVVGAGLFRHAVDERAVRLTLHQLLQHGLIIAAALLHDLLALTVEQHAVDQAACGGKPAVEIDRGDDRLGRVREDGRTGASAAGLLTVAQLEVAAQLQLLRDLMQALLANERRADARQLALGRVGMPRKKILRRDEAEHAVAQKLQPLVAHALRAAVLVGIGAVAQSLGEQGSAAEAVAQLTFQFLQGVSPPFS